jgi:peptide/nickel transport system permease protein
MATTSDPLLTGAADALAARPPLTPGRLAWRRFRRHRMAMFGLALLILLLLYVIVGSVIFSEKYANYNDIAIKLQPPSAAHPFGTDAVGRDVLARTVYGGQISLLIGLSAVAVALVVGSAVGALSGYYGKWVDSILMRFTEAMLCIPQLFLLIVAAKFLSDKVQNFQLLSRQMSGGVIIIIVIIGLDSWMLLARIVRSQFLSLKQRDFVLAARCIGTSNRSIILRHILPNTLAPIIVNATLGVAAAVLTEAYISFLGLGVRQPTATWGNMLENTNKFLETAPWLWLFPGLLILLTVLAINFVGDGLRDALDPRSRPA